MYFCCLFIILFADSVHNTVPTSPRVGGNREKIIKRRAIKEDDWIWGPVDRIVNSSTDKIQSSEFNKTNNNGLLSASIKEPNSELISNAVLNNQTKIKENIKEENITTRINTEDEEPSIQTLNSFQILYSELNFPKKNNRVIVKPDPPCKEFELPIFRKGSRISETKCREQIWKLNAMERIDTEDYICHYNPDAAVGGRDTFPGEFPHMGAVGWSPWDKNSDYVFKCGSSLISPFFLLTAAHCSEAPLKDNPDISDPIPKIVRLSYKNLYAKKPRDNYQDSKIKAIYVHPDYKSPTKYNDVALLELEWGINYSYFVQPACLWTKEDITELESFATVTGWGVLQEGSRNISAELQAAVVDFIDSDECETLLQPWCSRNWCGLEETQLCAGVLAGGVDACQGDSGGPLQVKISLNFRSTYNLYYIVGVTSFGIGCAQPNIPGVYTRVSSFIDWIEEKVWPVNKNVTT
ncbi:serine protease snake isoform X4 [Bombyx mori]|uniref:Peptidase S1 domain-containing protein n=1 Tax=Bombyx mori TaxID=7091 RepID=A0A8R2DL68_BOMMO|nr:serine protease snake isoform X2 [Bombyx mori]